MKTQEQIRAEIDQLLEAERFDEADALVDQLVPVNAEEFRRRLEEAPYDDEPYTDADHAAFARAWKVILGDEPTRSAWPA